MLNRLTVSALVIAAFASTTAFATASPTINPFTDKPAIVPARHVFPNHGKHLVQRSYRANTPSEYILRVKAALTKAWLKNTGKTPPAETILALIFDGDGELRYAAILSSSGPTPKNESVLKAAETAGPYPLIYSGDKVEPVVITW